MITEAIVLAYLEYKETDENSRDVYHRAYRRSDGSYIVACFNKQDGSLRCLADRMARIPTHCDYLMADSARSEEWNALHMEYMELSSVLLKEAFPLAEAKDLIAQLEAERHDRVR